MNGFQAQATRPAEPRMYRVVAERIQELIREQQMEPGARLPSERDQAAALRVSRTFAGGA